MLVPLASMIWAGSESKKKIVGGGVLWREPQTVSLIKFAKYYDVISHIQRDYVFVSPVVSKIKNKYQSRHNINSNIQKYYEMMYNIQSYVLKDYYKEFGVDASLFNMEILKYIDIIKQFEQQNMLNKTKIKEQIELIDKNKNVKEIDKIKNIGVLNKKQLLDLFKNN